MLMYIKMYNKDILFVCVPFFFFKYCYQTVYLIDLRSLVLGISMGDV